MKTVRLNNLNLKLITIYLVVAAIIIDATSMYRYLTNSPLFDKGFRLPLSMICLLYVLQSKSFKVNNAIRIRLPIVMIVLFIYAYVTRSTSDRFLVSYVGAFFFLFVKFVFVVCFLRDRSGVGLRHIKFKMFIRY